MGVGMGYYIYYIWKYVTEEVAPKLEESHINLIKVIDQIRMLDNDLIRLQQKVNVVLEYEKLRNTSGDSDSDAGEPGSRGHDDVQVQKSKFQWNQSIKPLLDNREPRNEPEKGDSREA